MSVNVTFFNGQDVVLTDCATANAVRVKIAGRCDTFTPDILVFTLDGVLLANEAVENVRVVIRTENCSLVNCIHNP